MKRYSSYIENNSFAIFLFHGVIAEHRHQIRNYNGKHLLLDRFVEVLEDLRESGTAISMQQVAEATLSEKPLPSRSFAVTFDDGFENNYSLAAPALKKLGIPATFYITTNFIESNGSSWIDAIELVVEHSGELKVDLPLPGLVGVYSTVEEKIKLLDNIRRIVKSKPEIDPYEFADTFCRNVISSATNLDAELDQQQVIELDREALFTIGGHGHTHRILEFLDDFDLEREISISLALLADHLGHGVTHYSYPEGLVNCYSERVIQALKRFNVVCAPSAETGINHMGANLFHLKRITVV